jgi:predicted dehydrogenase
MLRVVVAGFGFMGMTHTGNLLKNPAVRLTAVADKNTDGIQKKLKEQSGNFSTGTIQPEVLSEINFYDDFAECLHVEKPDACIIAVHTNLHYELAKMALEAGVHVFLEKPFSLDVEEGKELIELAGSRNRILMVGHVVRFMPAYKMLKSWVDNGEYGQLEFLSLSRFSGIPSWGQWLEKQKEFGSSGGALFDLVIHDIDFAQWVCGIPESIDSYCLPGKLSNYDYISALWKYPAENLHVKIEGGNTYHSDYPFQASFNARFSNASIYYSSQDPEHITVASGAGIKLVPVGNPNDGFSGELDYFIQSIIHNRLPQMCSPESALETIKICYRHIRELQAV